MADQITNLFNTYRRRLLTEHREANPGKTSIITKSAAEVEAAISVALDRPLTDVERGTLRNYATSGGDYTFNLTAEGRNR